MSLPVSVQRQTRPLLLIAAILVALAFALWGAPRGLAALVGATLGVGNWFALRWLGARFVAASSRGGASLSLLLVAKIGLLMGVVYVLMAKLELDPIGLAFGLSVLFVGPALSGLLVRSNDSGESLNPAVQSAREER